MGKINRRYQGILNYRQRYSYGWLVYRVANAESMERQLREAYATETQKRQVTEAYDPARRLDTTCRRDTVRHGSSTCCVLYYYYYCMLPAPRFLRKPRLHTKRNHKKAVRKGFLTALFIGADEDVCRPGSFLSRGCGLGMFGLDYRTAFRTGKEFALGLGSAFHHIRMSA